MNSFMSPIDAIFRPFMNDSNFWDTTVDNSGTQWKNLDNWAFGMLGKMFFTAEFYRFTREKEVWDALCRQLDRIEIYCNKTKSNNYTLYFGRMGLAFFYKKMFGMTNQEIFLTKAKKMAKEYLLSDAGRFIFYKKSSLAEGTAGFLLYCLELCRHVKESWLTDAIDRQAELLIAQAELSDKGMYWHGNGSPKYRYTGLAYGCSGIALVFLEMGKIFRYDEFFLLANLALKYEDDYNAPYSNGWRQKGLMYGEAGVSLVKLYFGQLTDDQTKTKTWEDTAGALDRIVQQPLVKEVPSGIFEGLSGWGIALLEAYALTRKQECLHTARQIARILQERLTAGQEQPIKDISFGYGLSGIGYFLLQVNGPETPGHLVLPESVGDRSNGTDAGKGFSPDAGRIQMPHMGKRMLSKMMNHTMKFLESEFIAEMDAFFEGPDQPLPGNLMRFIASLDKQGLPEEKRIELNRISQKEYFIVNMKQSATNPGVAKNEGLIAGMDRILRLSPEDFLQLRLEVSKEIWILDQEEAIDVDFEGKISIEMLHYLLIVHGSRTFFYTINQFAFPEENVLGSMKLAASLFDPNNIVGSAVDRFVRFLTLQDRQTIDALRSNLGYKLNSQFIRLFRDGLIRGIRSLLITGFLVESILPEYHLSDSRTRPLNIEG